MCCSTKLCQIHYELIFPVSACRRFLLPAASRYRSTVRLRANNEFHSAHLFWCWNVIDLVALVDGFRQGFAGDPTVSEAVVIVRIWMEWGGRKLLDSKMSKGPPPHPLFQAAIPVICPIVTAGLQSFSLEYISPRDSSILNLTWEVCRSDSEMSPRCVLVDLLPMLSLKSITISFSQSTVFVLISNFLLPPHYYASFYTK